MNSAVIPTTRNYIQKKGIWVILGLLLVIYVSTVIAGEQWLYLIVLLVPFLIYYSIKKPFIFPLGVYVFLLPFDNLLALDGSSGGGTLTKLLGALSILVLLLKGTFENRLRKPDAAVLPLILFVFYCSLTICWAVEYGNVISKLPTLLGLLFLYLVMASYQINIKEYNTLKWFIFAGGIIAALIMMHSYFQGQHYVTTRASLMSETDKTDPNRFAFYLLFPIAVSFFMIISQSRKIVKMLFWMALGLILFAIFLTGSRGGLIGVGTIFVVTMLLKKKKITFGLVATALGFIVVSFVPDYFFERISQAAETGGAGRLDIWYVGWRALEKYWLVGAGFGNFPNAYTEFSGYAPHFRGLNRAPHNIIVGSSVELGVIGLSVLVLAIIKHFRLIQGRGLKFDEEPIMLNSVFWGMLVSSLFLDTLLYKPFWLMLMMIVMYRNASINASRKIV